MKYTLQVLLACLVFAVTPTFADDKLTKVKTPQEVSCEIKTTSIPKELEGLQWNRWTSKNFTVCALNDVQAQYLNKHLELVKVWTLARWGLYDVDYSVECKVIAVDKPELFKKLFNLDSTRVEVRRDDKGVIKETVIFLLANDNPSKIIPVPVTEVCLAEFAQKHNIKLGYWSTRGMSSLNGSIDQIKAKVLEVKPLIEKNEPIFFSKGLLEMNAENYQKLDDAKRKLYDDCAMMFCLLLRKEFGQDIYIKFMKTASESDPEAAIKSVLGFKDYSALDATFKRYMFDLTRDVSMSKTPDHYLQIREKISK